MASYKEALEFIKRYSDKEVEFVYYERLVQRESQFLYSWDTKTVAELEVLHEYLKNFQSKKPRSSLMLTAYLPNRCLIDTKPLSNKLKKKHLKKLHKKLTKLVERNRHG